MRQKKSKFKKQEHRTFIGWFIAVPAKITSTGHQIELKMYEYHSYKAEWEELLTGSSKHHRNRMEGNMDTNTRMYGRGLFR